MNRSEMTLAIHAGEEVDPTHGALNAPIYQTATFAFDTAQEKEDAVDRSMRGAHDAYFYSRTSNPTVHLFEKKMAALEGAEAAVATSSGMGAVSSVLFAFLNAGDHFVVSDNMFTITEVLMQGTIANKGITYTSVNITDTEAVAAAMQENTKLIFTETLTNPYMHFADLRKLAEIAHSRNAKLVVDNTFLTPSLLKPIEYGVDIVLHSATKYLGGHGDVVAGVVSGSDADMGRIRIEMDAIGACMNPFSSWLVARGMRTLPLRMRAHSENGLAIAEYLSSHPEVDWVRYIGLPGDEDHDLAAQYMSNGFGGMVSFRMKKGEPAMATFCQSLELAVVAVSLGDLHTLAYPMPKRNFMVRYSVGCEDTDDLLADAKQALEKVAAL